MQRATEMEDDEYTQHREVHQSTEEDNVEYALDHKVHPLTDEETVEATQKEGWCQPNNEVPVEDAQNEEFYQINNEGDFGVKIGVVDEDKTATQHSTMSIKTAKAGTIVTPATTHKRYTECIARIAIARSKVLT